MLVIIPCGGKKAAHATHAARLYQGSYFKACARYALSIAKPDQIRILSAKHGLLKLDEIIEPYDLRMGMKGCVTADQVREQAKAQNLLDEQDVTIVAGSDYAKVALAVWSQGKWILQGLGGMGYQIQWLSRMSKKAKA